MPKIKDNLITIRNLIGDQVKLAIMVKALAYGTDATNIATYLQQENVVDYFGVAYASEATALRKNGVTRDILVMSIFEKEARDMVKRSITTVVSSKEVALALSQAAESLQKTAKIHLKIDTGMGRLGVLPEDALDLALFVNQLRHVTIEGVMTHFSVADDPEGDDYTEQQIQRFEEVVQLLKSNGIEPPLVHAAATSGIIRHPHSHFSMVRLGLGAYGIYPSSAVEKEVQLKCPFALVSRICQIKEYEAGVPISYGRTFYTQRKSKIGVLSIGYHDGLRRSLSNRGYVKVKGKTAPIVGTICMDFTAVDLTDIPEAQVGDFALIFGELDGDIIRIEEISERIDSIPYEVLSTLSPRIQRIYSLE